MTKRMLKTAGIIACVVVLFGSGVWVGVNHQITRAQDTDRNTLFAPFWEAWDVVHEYYVDPSQIDDVKLREGAIAGMVNALRDQHSGYMDPELFQTLTQDSSGEFEGIGATVRKDLSTGGLMIVSTYENSPAREYLQRGDIIVVVEDQDVTQMNEMQIISLVRGPAGTKVTLGVLRNGEYKEFTLERRHFVIETVTWALYPNNIGYLKLAEFNDVATAKLTAALRKMKADELKGLVLDLRNNPGGGLQTALDIASQFIDEGTLVVQRGRPGTKDIVYKANGNAIAPKVPLVVLVNDSSASASELVSGALQDYQRAVIVGEKTYGKGSVQSWRPMSDGGGLRITIAHFFTPDDHAVDKVGIQPDVEVKWTPTQESDLAYDPQLQEALWILDGRF